MIPARYHSRGRATAQTPGRWAGMVARHRAAAAETVRLERDPNVIRASRIPERPLELSPIHTPRAGNRRSEGSQRPIHPLGPLPGGKQAEQPTRTTKPQFRRPSRPVRGSRRTPCGASSERDRPGRGRKKSRSEAICPPVVPRTGARSVKRASRQTIHRRASRQAARTRTDDTLAVTGKSATAAALSTRRPGAGTTRPHDASRHTPSMRPPPRPSCASAAAAPWPT